MRSEIIKVIFAFFSVSLLLFGSNALMMTSYSQPQPQKVPSQGEQLLPQLQIIRERLCALVAVLLQGRCMASADAW